MRLFLFGIVIALTSAPLFSQQPTIAVVEKKAGKVGFYDAGGKRLGEVKVGNFPHETAFSPDGKLLYVTDNGLLWLTDPGEGVNTISIIDVATRKKVGVIDLGNYRKPHGIEVLQKTGQIVVTIENPDGLLLVDPVARKVLKKYDVKGKHPHMVTLGPGGENAYVSNAQSGDVSVVNLASGKVLKVLKTGENPQGGVLTKDGKTLYIGNEANGLISIIDTATNKVVGEIKTSIGPGRVCLTPDEKTLVYNIQKGQGAGFADVKSRKEIADIKLPGAPLSASLSRDGRTAYFGIMDSDEVAVVSVPERKIIRIIPTPTGAGPDTVTPLS
jgi:YVTN family beta-propeller protein